MEQILNDKIVTFLSNNKPLVEIAVTQKAKFEGWLKFELASELRKTYNDTEVEFAIPDIGFIDLFTNESLVELKTPNTNYTVEYSDHHSRPITMNVNSILKDIQKLNRTSGRNGYIAFVMFPIDDEKYIRHIKKIVKAINDLNKGFVPVQTKVNIYGENVLVFTSRVK